MSVRLIRPEPEGMNSDVRRAGQRMNSVGTERPAGPMRDQMGRVSSGSAGRRCGINNSTLAIGHSAASTKPSIR
ncbi:hypothetical protein LMG27177_02850 [Paraburkholderia fynbosensis]|uniref:Uncharacterized protein n=1 Tax=Paraburkholderia fynbosensis TaxID=1200993 RepID=A0A6J5G0Y0_9BURK|nr:hypothetical protein LMG27177_02850 [Paraburkholderia fynbosensis]